MHLAGDFTGISDSISRFVEDNGVKSCAQTEWFMRKTAHGFAHKKAE